MNQSIRSDKSFNLYEDISKDEWESLMSLIPQSMRSKIANLFIHGVYLSECSLGLRLDREDWFLPEEDVPYHLWSKQPYCIVVDSDGNETQHPLSSDDWVPQYRKHKPWRERRSDQAHAIVKEELKNG